jgi:hypothetical protein
MGTILKMKKDRILKDILKMKRKRECRRGRLRSRCEQPVRKGDMQKEGTRQKQEADQIFGKTEIGGDASYCSRLVYGTMQSGEDSGGMFLQIIVTHLIGHKMNLYYCENLRFCME